MHKSIGNTSKIRVEAAGWLQEALQRDAQGFTGMLHRLSPDADSGIFAANKAIPRNKVTNTTNDTWSAWWPGETEGNWTEAFVRLAYSLDDQELRNAAKERVYRLLQHQEEDGYIGINTPENRFGNSGVDGELWTQSRAMRILLAYLEHQEDEKVFLALQRMADRTIQAYGPLSGGRSYFQVPDVDGSKGHGLMIIEPLLCLFEQTGKSEYLTFCEFLYDDFSRGSSLFPVDDLRLPRVLDQDQPFVGHGPHICENLRIPLLLYAANGQQIYLDAFLSGYKKAVGILSLSGSMKSDELAGAPLNALSGLSGVDLCGCPPLPEAGYEYCSTVEWMLSMLTAASILKDKNFLDHFEWAVYNAAVAARQADGKSIQYLCADNLYEATKARGARWDYSPTHEDAAVCCVPNAGKVWPLLASNLWAWQEDCLIANCYAPSWMETQLHGRHIRIRQETRYPFETSSSFVFSLEEPQHINMAFRLPGWSRGYSLTVNGEAVKVHIEQGFLQLSRCFQDGDRIQLNMHAQPRALTAVDGSLALAHGPLLYSLPISAQAEPTFDYGFGGFYDLDLRPREGERWDFTLALKEGQPLATFSQKEASGYPWENPGVSIHALAFDHDLQPHRLKLFPIGFSRLRRTSFPAFETTGIPGLGKRLARLP